MLPLDSTLLKQAAASHRQFVAATGQFLAEHQPQWSQAFSVATGQAYDAGQDTLGELVTSMMKRWEKSHQLAEYLELTAAAQQDLEEKLDMVKRIAAAFGVIVVDRVVTPTTITAVKTAPLVQQIVDTIYLWGEMLDKACAWEVRSLTECALPPDPKAELLGDIELQQPPQNRLAQQHSQAMAVAPPEIKQLLIDHPGAKLLQVSDNNFAVAFGDPYTATAVNSVYHGVGSAKPEQWHADLDRIKDFHGAIVGKLAPEKISTATVMFVNLDSPPALHNAIEPSAAIRGAQQVQDFQHALTSSNPNAKRITCAHSFASVTMGYAAQLPKGLDTDTVINVGSPGNRTDSAQDLQLNSENPRVITAINDEDPIQLVEGIHGVDPASPEYGAEVWNLHGDHSSYFRDPTFQHLVAEEIKKLVQSE